MASEHRCGEDGWPGCDDRPHTDDRFAETEALIRSAGRYVWPSDDLRPRVLEAARERVGQRHTRYRLAVMMVAAALGVMTGVSVSNHLQASADSAAMPRGERLDELVEAHAAASGQTHDWALADIVDQWRKELAERLPEGAVPTRKRQND